MKDRSPARHDSRALAPTVSPPETDGSRLVLSAPGSRTQVQGECTDPTLRNARVFRESPLGCFVSGHNFRGRGKTRFV
jgi:hypothetical protein